METFFNVRIGPRIICALIVSIVTALPSGCKDSKKDTQPAKTRYGQRVFLVIVGTDPTETDVKSFSGIFGIDNGQLAQNQPGAVFVVGVRQGVKMGDSRFEYRQIILRDPDGKLVLAPPGALVSIPHTVEILGRKYHEGTFLVPDTSLMPEGDVEYTSTGDEPEPRYREPYPVDLKDSYPPEPAPAGAFPRKSCCSLDYKFQQLLRASMISVKIGPEGRFRLRAGSKLTGQQGYTFTADDGGRIRMEVALILEGEFIPQGTWLQKENGWWVRSKGE